MNPSGKFVLIGIIGLLLSVIFILWGINDILSVIKDPTIEIIVILSIMIPYTILIIIGIVILIVKINRKKKELFFLNEKNWIYNCPECGARINLSEKVCSKCGVENVTRKDALEKLEMWEQSIDKQKAKVLEKQQSSKSRRSPRSERLEKFQRDILLRLDQQSTKAKVLKKKLLTGKYP
ncbi:MAG: zinc ribbon domain-containing protein [Promethearchaeota archaeon]